MIRILFIALVFMLCGGANAADRVALVIGNGAYQNVAELPNPANDANAIASVLEGMGFEVIKGVDLDEQGMEQALRSFVAAMRDARIVLFYYAGHGLQVGGKNYLIPVDARLEDEAALDFETIDADKIFGYMGASERVALAFLDACRDNPFTRSLARSLGATRGAPGSGLAAPETIGSGLFIGFATAPNDVAADGRGVNSPFTTAMLKHLPTPGLEINQVLTRVKADVRAATDGGQRPWTNSDLMTDVYLVPSVPEAQIPTPSEPEADVASIDPAAIVGAQSLLLEVGENGTGAIPFSGTVSWTLGADGGGMPTLVGEVSVPARNLRLLLTIRRNWDRSFPASHLMELDFTTSEGFEGGSIAGLPGVLLKNEELVQGSPLIGASARVVTNSFLFALSASPADLSANLDLLGTRKFIDFAVIYATGTRAILTLEKDPLTEELFRDVLRAWSSADAAAS